MSLIDRAKAILLTPQKEWPVIEAESTSVAALYTGYIIPLAAIPAVASFIGLSVFGFGGILRVPMGMGITGAIVRFVGTLIGVYILALIIDALAPTFGGQKSQIQALKLAAYSSTASWLAGIFMLIPALAILGIVGLYSLYLLYAGLPVMMKSPADKAMGYTVVVILAAIVLFAVVGAITARMMGYGAWY